MLPAYSDIRALTERKPDWYDARGVPRYARFHPSLLGVYDRMAVLVEIECASESCGKRLLVGDGLPQHNFVLHRPGDVEFIENKIERFVEGWSFGDPPRHDCPGGGETMVCNEVRIVEVWEQLDFEWRRRSDLEVALVEGEA